MIKFKKSWIIGAGLVAVLGGAGAAFAATVPAADYIGKAKAKQVALKEVPGTVTDVDLERHSGTVYYEVDIDRKETFREADVYIDALSGKVLRVVEDDDDDDDDDRRSAAGTAPGTTAGNAAATPSTSWKQPSSAAADSTAASSSQAKSNPSTGSTKDSAGAAAVKITSESAVEIAMQAVQGELIRVKTDRDDGRLEYEVKLKTLRGTAEVEISASTGTVLDIDYDNDRDDDRDDDDDDDWDDDWDDDDN